MKISEIQYFNGSKAKLHNKDEIWNEIVESLSDPALKFKKTEARNMKNKVSNSLNRFGWGDTIKIEPTNLSINFIKQNVGLCIQLGNVARTYADLLKIELLYERKLIDMGVIAVPIYSESKKFGSNYSQYERLVEELKLFKNIITTPIIVVGLTS